jgi:PAS domain S-box-containing protein
MARYTALAQSESPDAVLIITPDGKVLHWDAGAEALFGFTGDDAIGRSIFELTVPSDRHPEEAQLLASTLSDGKATFESLRSPADCRDGLLDAWRSRCCDLRGLHRVLHKADHAGNLSGRGGSRSDHVPSTG